MSNTTLPAFSVCPFRSPVEIPEEQRVYSPPSSILGGQPAAKAPRQAIGQCFGLGCGVWQVTQVNEQGQPVAGMCGFKASGPVLAAMHDQLVKLTARLTSIQELMVEGGLEEGVEEAGGTLPFPTTKMES